MFYKHHSSYRMLLVSQSTVANNDVLLPMIRLSASLDQYLEILLK